jgi:hypothetical protein
MHFKSLAYALDRDLRRDRFVFRRTARAMTSMLENGTSNVTFKELEELENLLISKENFTDEHLMEHRLNDLFGNESNNKLFAINLEAGVKLLEVIRNKKEALRPPL